MSFTTTDEFLRRFLLHVLPKKLMRIRYFGFLANCHRAEQLTHCRRLLGDQTTLDFRQLVIASNIVQMKSSPLYLPRAFFPVTCAQPLRSHGPLSNRTCLQHVARRLLFCQFSPFKQSLRLLALNCALETTRIKS